MEKRQAELDQEKYIQSERVRIDKSGLMLYCKNCLFDEKGRCAMSQEDRVKYSTCARNEKRLQEDKKREEEIRLAEALKQDAKKTNTRRKKA